MDSSCMPQVNQQKSTLGHHCSEDEDELSNVDTAMTGEDLEQVATADASINQLTIFADEESGSISESMEDSCSEPPSKRMFLETLTQDGQTYVLTLHDESGMIHATPIPALSLPEPEKQPLDEQQCTSPPPEENVSDVSQAWFTSREDKTNLHSRGHMWRQGMWSKEEVELLDINIKQYCIEHNIADPAEVIFGMSKDERKDFYRFIAKGLNRPLFSVYRRVIRMYDNKNHVGKYTPEEMEKLRNLRAKHGNDWQAIGTQMGRSASSIKDKCRLMKDNCNTGKWFPREENLLAEAVYELSNAVPGEIVTTGISWAAVAQSVGTRSEKQCRTKWLNYLNWKQVGGAEWSRVDDVALVTKMCSLDVLEESQVDWSGLANGWNSVRSPQWLRGKWWSLKRHIPGIAQLTFKEVCQYLYTHHVENVHLKSGESPPSLLQSADVGVVTTTAISLPHMRLVQVPITMKAEDLALSDESLGMKQASMSTAPTTLQTFEVLPPGLQLATSTSSPTYYFTPQTTCTSLPYATATSTGQIIIQALTTEGLQNAENVAVHLNIPSQIIITDPDASTLGPLAHHHDPGSIQLADSIHKDHLQSFDRANVLLNSDELGMNPNEDSKEDLGPELPFGSQDICRASISTNTPQLTESLETVDLDQSEHELSTHFMLADPLLQGRADSPLMGSSSDLDDDKDNCSDNSLDCGVVQDDT